MKAYHAETTEAFCCGHVEDFAFICGVSLSILDDDTRPAVAQILGGGTGKHSHILAAPQCLTALEDRELPPVSTGQLA